VADKAVPVDNAFTTTEWVFFVGETLPIFATFIVYCVWHFGQLLPDTPDAAWKVALAVASGTDGATAAAAPVDGAGGSAACTKAVSIELGHVDAVGEAEKSPLTAARAATDTRGTYGAPLRLA
jgi:hypothetical protein